MKKLLNLLATVSLVSTSTASIVACGSEIIQDISTIISNTELGDINFYSLTGNDEQTQTEIINQIRTLNPMLEMLQINISNINRENGTAAISVVGFNGSLTVTFRVPELETVLEPVSFPSAPRSITQLRDGTILVAGATTGTANSFLASVDLSNSQIQILAQGSTAWPFLAVPQSMIQLQDGTILLAGGTAANGSDSFLASVDLSDLDNSQIRILAQGSDAFPSALRSITQLQDGTILVTGGNNAANSFLASVDLSDPANPQIQILAQGSTAFPAGSWSITQLQDGTILVTGGGNATNSFLASVDLSDLANPQIQILAQGLTSTAFPSAPISSIELQDGTILVTGGTAADGSDSFLASVDLSNPANPQIQILAQGSKTHPSNPWSIIELQDGTILVTGGTAANGSDSFLIRY